MGGEPNKAGVWQGPRPRDLACALQISSKLQDMATPFSGIVEEQTGQTANNNSHSLPARRVSFSTPHGKSVDITDLPPPSPLERRESRVSFSIPDDGEAEETATDGKSTQDTDDFDVTCGRPRSDSQLSQDHRPLQRRRSTVAELVLERFVITRERRWSVGLCTLVSTLLAFLMGYTIAFPSSAILDLTGEAKELPPDFLLSTLLLSIFAVRPLVPLLIMGISPGLFREVHVVPPVTSRVFGLMSLMWCKGCNRIALIPLTNTVFSQLLAVGKSGYDCASTALDKQ